MLQIKYDISLFLSFTCTLVSSDSYILKTTYIYVHFYRTNKSTFS